MNNYYDHMHRTYKPTPKGIFLNSCIRDLNTEFYQRWLWGHVNTGKIPTHTYTYPSTQVEFYILRKTAKLPVLYGAEALKIIVPNGVYFKTTYKDIGHTTIFSMSDFSVTSGSNWVPLYPDLTLFK